MKLKIALFLLAAFLRQTIVFSQTNPLFSNVPENASMVMSFNCQRIGSKVPGGVFRQSMIYKEMIKDSSKLPVNAFFMEPGQSGIDFSSDFLLASVQDTSAEHLKSYVHIFGRLQNEEQFNSLMKKLFKDDIIHVFGTNKIIFKAGNMIAWNKEIFVFSSGNEYRSWSNGVNLSAQDQDKDRQATEDKLAKMKEKMMKSKRELCFSLLTSHPGNTYNTDSRFTNLMNTAGDIKIWSNGKPGRMGINPFAGLTNKFNSVAGTNKGAVINFENGKILVQNRNYLPDALSAIYKKYPAPVLNTDLTRRLPKGKLLGLMITSYNPEMGNELLQKSGMQQVLDSMKMKLPFDFSSITSAFKNNMMLAVIKMEDGAPVDSSTRKMDGIEVLLVLPIADKAKFEKVKTIMTSIWDSLQSKEGVERKLKGFRPSVKYNEEFCVLSSSPAAANAFLENPGHEAPPEWLQAYSGHQMVMRVDMKEIFSIMMTKKPQGNLGTNEMMMDMIDQLIISGGGYENGSLNTVMEFKFTDQNENTLKQLFNMINSMAAENEKVKAENKKDGKSEKLLQF